MEDYIQKLERQNRELERELAINVDARKNLSIGLTKALLFLKGTVVELEMKKKQDNKSFSSNDLADRSDRHFLQFKVTLFNPLSKAPSTPEIDGMVERIQNG